ncbi:ribonucleoside-diphosphate reductase subunit alpha [Verrucomicrobia bacterium]|nr:ribonucleoside-diphosphate reductase subunit alpha [Verrucomicrobiota bacterium]
MGPIDPLKNKEFTVRKRDNRVISFDESRIWVAIESAFKAASEMNQDEKLSDEVQAKVNSLTETVVNECIGRAVRGDSLEIEQIQDVVERQMMMEGHHDVARRYILYRENRRKARALRGARALDGTKQDDFAVESKGGETEILDPQRIRREMIRACRGLEDLVSWQSLSDDTLQNLYDGVKTEEIIQAKIMAAKSRIEKEPAHTFVAARLLLNRIYKEVLGVSGEDLNLSKVHREGFAKYLAKGIELHRLDPKLLEFDLPKLADAMKLERDGQFTFLGIQTIYDRYLIHDEEVRMETPQYLWMRVCMGLSMNEERKTERAIEFYEVLSSFRFVSSTPTLFNSGTLHPQLSSCYLSTIMDDLEHIFKVVGDDARLSKWAGGLGNDWTNVRAMGSHIKGTNGTSQGVIPFLKVANDTAVAVNQGGKRKGAMCAYLETWHLDIEDFIELRKNTGDERRRTHDMNTANWIPDLFLKRVRQNGEWTLFSPNDVPDLHDLFGRAFELRYEEYERMTDAGDIKRFKRIKAGELWRKMITMLYETGHPWMTFKDPSNIRSPQDHTGVVHSSNLCTEILLNTSENETAVCNLGSINMSLHVNEHGIDEIQIAQTIRTAMRMLDNVIDINYYPTPEAKNSNMRHRPVGLGLMGFQDALYRLHIPYASDAAVDFSDRSMEIISYYSILSSTELARERGAYQTFKGSKWDRGLLPIDTLDLLEKERGGYVNVNRDSTMDWSVVRKAVAEHGMRNSNCMAIAPTATISNIAGVTQSIEPTYSHLFVKSNLSGEFTVINPFLVVDLKKLDLWDKEMIDDLKYYDGSLAQIERIPAHVKELYATSFEIDAKWLIECAARRQKWIDMGQSLNLYMASPKGNLLSEMYLTAWERGLKTTYYLRATAATTVEKSTLDVNSRGLQPRWMKNKSASADVSVAREDEAVPVVPATIVGSACSISDPDCDACQ